MVRRRTRRIVERQLVLEAPGKDAQAQHHQTKRQDRKVCPVISDWSGAWDPHLALVR
jgi:hypothetical protein